MNLSLIYFILIGIFTIYYWNKDTSSNRKKYIIISCLILLIGPSLRSINYGVEEAGLDTHKYYEFFHIFRDYSFQEIWSTAMLRYFGVGADEFDIGFVMLCKLIGLITSNFHVYTFIALCIFFVPFGIFLYRHVQSIAGLFLAFIFYIALISSLSMGGARQMYAMGMGITVHLLFERKRYLYAAIAFIVGLTFHFSMLLIVLPIALSYLSSDIQKKIHLISLVIFPVVFMMPNQIIVFMGEMAGSEKYAEYGKGVIQGGANTFIFLLELLSLFCYIGIKKDFIGEKVPKLWYAMLPCLTFFGPLINSNGSMMRITMYFFVYLTMLLPYATEGVFPMQEKKYMRIMAIILILLVLTSGSIPYYFYWYVDPVSSWN